MNVEQREALIQAGLTGTPKQIVGRSSDGEGGACAVGVLMRKGLLDGLEEKEIQGCPLCGAVEQTYHKQGPIGTELELMVHYNNDHHFDFLTIANKMPMDPEEG